MSQAHNTARVHWVDTAKGIAIILVVIGHTWRGIFDAGLVPAPLFGALDTRIYAFHMPVFFFLSGYFYLAVIAKLSTFAYLRRIAVKIAWPMVLWTYIFVGAKVAAGSFSNAPLGLGDIPFLPVPGFAHLWYLWALLVMSVLMLPLGTQLREGKLPAPVLLGVGLLVLALWVAPLPIAVHYWTSLAFRFLPFFYLGVILGQFGVLADVRGSVGLLAGALFIVGLAVWPAIAEAGHSRIGAVVLMLSFVTLVAYVSAVYDYWGKNWLIALGQASLVIYLAHTIFSAGLREVMLLAGIEGILAHVVLGTVAGIVGPLLISQAAKLTKTSRAIGIA